MEFSFASAGHNTTRWHLCSVYLEIKNRQMKLLNRVKRSTEILFTTVSQIGVNSIKWQNNPRTLIKGIPYHIQENCLVFSSMGP